MTPDLPQYSYGKIAAIWAAVALPMPILAFGVAPVLAARTGLHPGVAIWLLMILGMAWQFVLSLWLLSREGSGHLPWQQRIWLQSPRDPTSGAARLRLLWWVLPVILATFVVEVTPLKDLLAAPLAFAIPALAAVPAPDLSDLATPDFIGAWWLVGIALISFAFNYFLGEELLVRGVLLPRMRGAFGKWDWVANAVLFGSYHLIRPLMIPSIIVSTLVWAYPARRFRSVWFAVIPHAIEGMVLTVLVLGVVTGAAFR